MSKKKVALLVIIAIVALYFVWGFLAGRNSSGKSETTLAKPPSASFEISQGNWMFYTDQYESQGKTIILSDFYALVDGKWKHVRGQTPTILSERNGEIKIRRLD